MIQGLLAVAFAVVPAEVVVVVAPPFLSVDDDELIVRLRAELVTAGFTVRVERGDVGTARGQVERRLGADVLGAILVQADGELFEVWVADSLTKKTVVRTLKLTEPPATLAVQAAELLRASLAELVLEPAKQPVSAPVLRLIEPPQVRAVPATSPPWWGRLGVVTRWAPGVSVALGPSMAFGRALRGALGIEVALVGPTWAVATSANAVASVREVSAQGRAVYTVRLDERLELPLCVGLGWRTVTATGLSPESRARTAEASTLDVALGAAVWFRLVGPWWVDLQALAVASAPPVELSLDGERVAQLVLPGLHLSLGLALRW